MTCSQMLDYSIPSRFVMMLSSMTGARMRIDLYTLCWNDADMLGFFFRHYDRFVQRYIVYDDGSTDQSLEILHANRRWKSAGPG